MQFVMAFESQGWKDQVFIGKVVQALLGDSTRSISSRFLNNIVLNQNSADSVKTVNFNFSDSGLVGV